MIDIFFKQIVKEYEILKQSPFSFLFLVITVGTITFYAISWHYGERLEALKEKASLYEAKLEVTSPDEALEKFQKIQENLNVALELAGNKVLESIKNLPKCSNSGMDCSAWLEPICISSKDTPETKRQVITYHLLAKEYKIKNFFDKNYCGRKYKSN